MCTKRLRCAQKFAATGKMHEKYITPIRGERADFGKTFAHVHKTFGLISETESTALIARKVHNHRYWIKRTARGMR